MGNNKQARKRRLDPLVEEFGNVKCWSWFLIGDQYSAKDKAPRRERHHLMDKADEPRFKDDGEPMLGTTASTGRLEDFVTFQEAIDLANEHRHRAQIVGVGVQSLAMPGILLLDLDKCRDPEAAVKGDILSGVTDWARELLERILPYARVYVSVSGTGFRAIMRVDPDLTPSLGAVLDREEKPHDGQHLEVYHYTERFTTITPPGKGEIGDCPEDVLDELIEEIAADATPGKSAGKRGKKSGARHLPTLRVPVVWGDRDAMADFRAKPCRLSEGIRNRIDEAGSASDRSTNWQRIVGRMWAEGYSKKSTDAVLEQIEHPLYFDRYSGRIHQELDRSARTEKIRRMAKAAGEFK